MPDRIVERVVGDPTTTVLQDPRVVQARFADLMKSLDAEPETRRIAGADIEVSWGSCGYKSEPIHQGFADWLSGQWDLVGAEIADMREIERERRSRILGDGLGRRISEDTVLFAMLGAEDRGEMDEAVITKRMSDLNVLQVLLRGGPSGFYEMRACWNSFGVAEPDRYRVDSSTIRVVNERTDLRYQYKVNVVLRPFCDNVAEELTRGVFAHMQPSKTA